MGPLRIIYAIHTDNLAFLKLNIKRASSDKFETRRNQRRGCD